MRARLADLFARRPGLGLALAYFGLGLVVSLDPRATHDEGLLMYGFARALSDAFVPCLFLQKIKPALALVYLPFARLGLGVYLVAHLAVASIAVYLLGETARAMGQRRPWLPALVLALSPLFTWSALVGVSNSDGVAGVVLFLYLLEARKSALGAGLVLGILPWLRYENALFCSPVALYVLFRDRSRAFFGGLVAWPLLYLGGGAIYHRDALWFVHYLPNVSELMPENEVWANEFLHHDFSTGALALAMVSPAVFLLLLLRVRKLLGIEKALAAFSIGFFALFLITHVAPRNIGPAFTLGFSSRYAVVPLAAVGLLLGRAVEGLEDEKTPRLRDTAAAVFLLVVGFFLRLRGVLAPLWAAASTGSVVAAARGHASRLMLGFTIAFLALAPLSFREQLLQEYPLRDASLPRLADTLEGRRNELGAEIFTNHQLLGPYLQRKNRLEDVRVKFLLAADHHFELVHLTNPKNGQRAAILDAVPRGIFGDVVMPEALDPSKIKAGTTFVLVDDPRTKLILPPAVWSAHLKTIAKSDGVTIATFVP